MKKNAFFRFFSTSTCPVFYRTALPYRRNFSSRIIRVRNIDPYVSGEVPSGLRRATASLRNAPGEAHRTPAVQRHLGDQGGNRNNKIKSFREVTRDVHRFRAKSSGRLPDTDCVLQRDCTRIHGSHGHQRRWGAAKGFVREK